MPSSKLNSTKNLYFIPNSNKELTINFTFANKQHNMNFLGRFFLLTTTILLFSQCSKDTSETVSEQKITSNLQQEEEQVLVANLLELSRENTAITGSERDFILELRVMAHDVDGYFEGVDPTSSLETQYEKIRANMYARVKEAEARAMVFYNGSEAKSILAKNSYVLMSYDALQQYAPEFYWTQLGIFAANEVRSGIVLAYILKHLMLKNDMNIKIDQLVGVDVDNLMMEATRILMGGQTEVFSDIGALALVNRLHGPEVMSQQTWLTEEAQRGYELQIQAEQALRAGQTQQYKDLQTTAAIEFGAHEQIYILQKLWDKDLMVQFSVVNEWLMGISKGKLSVFGNIFVGTNKYGEMLFGHTIPLPMHAANLTQGVDRVEIARNGFQTLNKLRKELYWEKWIKSSQAKIGNQNGVYHVRNLKLD